MRRIPVSLTLFILNFPNEKISNIYANRHSNKLYENFISHKHSHHKVSFPEPSPPQLHRRRALSSPRNPDSSLAVTSSYSAVKIITRATGGRAGG